MNTGAVADGIGGIEQVEYMGRPALRLRCADGAEALVLLHGAHLVSWRTASGREQLFLSDQARYADGQAVRGGVPVIFPQFEKRGPLPRHGLARTRSWECVGQRAERDHATVTLRLTDDESTRSHWPYQFAAELTISIGANSLDIELCTENTGVQTFSFSAALHTYLRVDDLSHVRLSGLAGLTYLDSTTGHEHIETASSLAIEGEVDRIYFRAAQPLSLREPGRAVAIQSQGFEDVVVWNPGPQKCLALADMSADGWRQMLCVEAASIGRPIELQAGQDWVGRQSLVAIG